MVLNMNWNVARGNRVMFGVMQDACMITRASLACLLAIIVGCEADVSKPIRSAQQASVYQLAISDLTKKRPPDPHFVGTKALVSHQFSKGDSLVFGWSDDLGFDEELVETIRKAQEDTDTFPPKEEFGPDAVVTDIESFWNLEYYYGTDNKTLDARCLVQFWRAGYTGDGKRAVVRFRYGPSSHGAVGTCIFKHTHSGWKLIVSNIDYYL